METVFNNVWNYWNTNYYNWGYNTSPSVGHYWPAIGETVYNGCDNVYEVDVKAAYYCPTNDYIIFSQAAAVDLWNGAYVPGTTSSAPGDFALAMAMAHEFGHNITFELWPQAHTVFTRYQIEGFADCLAGTWANSVYYQGILEGGDIEEAIAVLLTFNADGYPSGPQRAEYFALGYNTGSPAECATTILQQYG